MKIFVRLKRIQCTRGSCFITVIKVMVNRWRFPDGLEAVGTNMWVWQQRERDVKRPHSTWRLRQKTSRKIKISWILRKRWRKAGRRRQRNSKLYTFRNHNLTNNNNEDFVHNCQYCNLSQSEEIVQRLAKSVKIVLG